MEADAAEAEKIIEPGGGVAGEATDFDANAFLLNDADHRRLGGGGAAAGGRSGVTNAMAKAIRDYTIANKIACFKVRCNIAARLDVILNGIIAITEVSLVTDSEIAPATDVQPCNGQGGARTGALKCVFILNSDVQKLCKLMPDCDTVSGYCKLGAGGLQFTMVRDRMCGSLGHKENVIWGMRESPSVLSTRSFICKPAVASQILIDEWAAQFDEDPDTARFQISSKLVGQAMGPNGLEQMYCDFIEIGEEAKKQRNQIVKLDYDKLALRANLEKGKVKSMSQVEAYKAKVQGLKESKPMGSTDPSICQRTIVGFNIKPATTEEEVRHAIKEAVESDVDNKEELKDTDIEVITVRRAESGNWTFKVQFTSSAKMELVYWADRGAALQRLHDGKGPQGVRLAIDTPINERRNYMGSDRRRVSTWSGPGGNQVSPWKNPMMSAVPSIDADKLAEAVCRKMTAAMSEKGSPFVQAVATMVNEQSQSQMRVLRDRLTLMENMNIHFSNSMGVLQFATTEGQAIAGGEPMQEDVDSVLGQKKKRGDDAADTDLSNLEDNIAAKMVAQMMNGQMMGNQMMGNQMMGNQMMANPMMASQGYGVMANPSMQMGGMMSPMSANGPTMMSSPQQPQR